MRNADPRESGRAALAAETWLRRRMAKTSWTARPSNVISNQRQSKRKLGHRVICRKTKSFGNPIRHNGPLNAILEAQVIEPENRKKRPHSTSILESVVSRVSRISSVVKESVPKGTVFRINFF